MGVDRIGCRVDPRRDVASTNDLPVGEAHAEAILDAALDAVITIDHLGSVLEFNRAAERIFGFPKEDVLGHELATRAINLLRGTPGGTVWQRGYYERVVRDEDELEALREYVIGNPAACWPPILRTLCDPWARHARRGL